MLRNKMMNMTRQSKGNYEMKELTKSGFRGQNQVARFSVLMETTENLQRKRKEICKEVLNLNEKLNTYMLNKPKKDD